MDLQILILLQAGVMAAGLDGINNKIDPGEPLFCNMYTDYKNYPNLERLPNELEESLDNLEENKTLKDIVWRKSNSKLYKT